MNVVIDAVEPIATRVWFDPRDRALCVEINGMVASLDFTRIPEDDFESQASIVRFTLGAEGSIVVCHHQDGAETWLPVDMWLPGGFTPN
jgi:hypothetical protein